MHMTPQERNLSDVPWQVAAKLGRFFVYCFSAATSFSEINSEFEWRPVSFANVMSIMFYLPI